MNDELKTLKDILHDFRFDGNALLVKEKWTSEKRLKEEAIKWVKGARLYEFGLRESEYTKRWIIHFFNLTEKDLTSSHQTPQTKPDRVKSDNGRNFVQEQFGQEGQTEESSSEGCGKDVLGNGIYICGRTKMYKRPNDEKYTICYCNKCKQKQEKKE